MYDDVCAEIVCTKFDFSAQNFLRIRLTDCANVNEAVAVCMGA